MNDNESSGVNHNLWDSAKAVYRGEHTALECAPKKNFIFILGEYFSI